MSQPTVAVLCTNEERGQPYADVLARCAASPLLVPCHWEQTRVQQALRQAKGLLITGGGDIDPCHYGQKPTCEPMQANPDRDALDRIGVHFALSHPELPVLGICRGIQAFNVFAGGDLIQDIPTEICDCHEAHKAIAGDYHPVRIKPRSQLAEILGARQLAVNSFHHQAVNRPAAELVVTARAPDGVIEALERPTARWTVLVQWHPERMFDEHQEARRLFESFVAACR